MIVPFVDLLIPLFLLKPLFRKHQLESFFVFMRLQVEYRKLYFVYFQAKMSSDLSLVESFSQRFQRIPLKLYTHFGDSILILVTSLSVTNIDIVAK